MTRREDEHRFTSVLGLHITRSSDRRRALLGLPLGVGAGAAAEGASWALFQQEADHRTSGILATMVALFATSAGLLHAEINYGDSLQAIGVTRREARKMIKETKQIIRKARRG